ncbi:MAG TPA: four helix bundle protein [Chlamydiales bacterium]|nr:four helix bundle protein [Chlamydiales bacterium]
MQKAEVVVSAFVATDLSVRTKSFALRIIRLFQSLPSTVEGQVIGKQVLRSGTSVGAQYREAKRARSKAEFHSKLESALQELEETGYWLELLVESGIVSEEKLSLLPQEQDELTAILVTATNTAKTNK